MKLDPLSLSLSPHCFFLNVRQHGSLDQMANCPYSRTSRFTLAKCYLKEICLYASMVFIFAHLQYSLGSNSIFSHKGLGFRTRNHVFYRLPTHLSERHRNYTSTLEKVFTFFCLLGLFVPLVPTSA